MWLDDAKTTGASRNRPPELWKGNTMKHKTTLLLILMVIAADSLTLVWPAVRFTVIPLAFGAFSYVRAQQRGI
jgi:hypothetical protein